MHVMEKITTDVSQNRQVSDGIPKMRNRSTDLLGLVDDDCRYVNVGKGGTVHSVHAASVPHLATRR
jgi:hypothetical protein